MERNVITIISCGKPGVGKSTLGNQLLTGDPKSNLFVTGKCSANFGVTQKIQGKKRMITLPNATKRMVRYLDIPGIGDPTIGVNGFVEQIQQKYQEQKLNIVLMLVNSQDIRKTYQENFCCAFFKAFFDKTELKSNQVLYLVITRWQECQMYKNDIKIKLKSLANDGLEIDPSRVIKYRLGCNEDLQPLLEQIQTLESQRGYTFKQNLNAQIPVFQSEIDLITNRNNDLKNEINQIKAQLNQAQNETANLNQQLTQSQTLQSQQLAEEKKKTSEVQKIVSQPRIIYRKRRNNCNII